jgi:beta-xylosidase
MKSQLLILCLLSLVVACKNDDPSLVSSIKFTKHPEPVWQGVWTAADPSVVRDGDTLRMYYSSLLINPTEKLLIAGAKSIDGINWMPANNIEGEESVALDINSGQWDNHLEAVTVIRQGSGTWMYYCGYQEEAEVTGNIVATGQIGLAKSTDNTTFTRSFNEPILELGSMNSKDANALFSPTIIKEGGTYYMLYMGYCIENCSPVFLGVLGATSTDGETWTKLSQPIISGADFNFDWAEVIKEPAIVKGPDNVFYLFISGDKFIGVARSNTILGPYELYPDPILKIDYDWEAASVIAPSVIIENNKVRMWYMGVLTSGTGADFAIGYAESVFPLDW